MAKMDEFREEREAMKNAPLKDRIAYFWEYNKLETFLVVFGTICVISIAVTILGRKDVVLEGMLINRFWMEMEGAGCESITEDYLAYRELDADDYDLMLNGSSNYFPNNDGVLIEENVNTSQLIAASCSAQSLDFIIAEPDTLHEFDQAEYFLDLRELLTAEQLEEYEEYLIYSEVQTEVPVMIDITGCEKVEELYAYDHEVLACGVILNAPHTEEMVHFVDYLMEQK